MYDDMIKHNIHFCLAFPLPWAHKFGGKIQYCIFNNSMFHLNNRNVFLYSLRTLQS